MRVSRLVIKNYRAIADLDVTFDENLSCIIGENNTGKSAILMAMRLCFDITLPSAFRSLIREDINSSIDISLPSQVLVGVEFTDFQGKLNQEALVATWKTSPDRARIFYRFRPKPSIREKLTAGEIEPGSLTLQDYSWEIKGGGNPANDLTAIQWNDEGIGENLRFSDLQSFAVSYLPALRDVENELRNTRFSPLVKLIEAFEIPEAEQEGLIAILDEANAKITDAKTISEIAAAVDEQFKKVSGPAFAMDSALGISAATFRAIIRNLKIILSDISLQNFEVGRNGLGMNNILYTAILLEFLNKRTSNGNSSGQIILLEEPEAHLHPQLQAALITALERNEHQIILTSHSTQVTSRVPLGSIISLTKRADASTVASNLVQETGLVPGEVSDLERYLDATKSNLLFARKVMLVEGATELFIIPAILKKMTDESLERLGISVVAIHGVHFDIYSRLFQSDAIEKKCAIVADADLKPSDSGDNFDPYIDAASLMTLENEFVNVFLGATTIERELATPGNLPMFISTLRDLGAPVIMRELESALERFRSGKLTPPEHHQLALQIGTIVLTQAKRFGKARFAQVAARHVGLAADIPKYIGDAFNWLNE